MEMCKRCECLFFAKDLSLGHCQECKRAVLDDIARESAEVLEKLTTPPTQERSVMEAPERIWVHDASEGTPETWDVYDSGGVEYVRADISQEFYAPQISALEQCIAEQDQHIESLQNRFAEATHSTPPPRYNDCKCPCHLTANFQHFVACCSPTEPPTQESDDE